jgi:hypothetical protein
VPAPNRNASLPEINSIRRPALFAVIAQNEGISHRAEWFIIVTVKQTVSSFDGPQTSFYSAGRQH